MCCQAEGTAGTAWPPFGSWQARTASLVAGLRLWPCQLTFYAVMQVFLDAVQNRGMGALELVAMDMKARGMYVCRTLSFKGEAVPEQASTRGLTC